MRDVKNEISAANPVEPIRVAVVGTSNSLAKNGYTQPLQNKQELHLTNFSIGASGSCHLVHSCKGVNFRDFDYCIIEFAVNEEVHIATGRTNFDMIEKIVTFLLVQCFEAKCVPVIVVLPRFGTLTDMSRSRAFYLDLAKTWRLPAIDGYVLIDRLTNQHGIPREALFIDNAHIAPWVSGIISDIIHYTLLSSRLRQNYWSHGKVEHSGYECISLHDAAQFMCDPKWRTSSRFSGAFLSLSRGKSYDFAIPKGCAIAALRLNLVESNAIIHISGALETLLDCRSAHYKTTRHSFLSVVLPLSREIFSKNGKVTLRILNDDDYASYSGSDRKSVTKKLKIKSGNFAEIGEFTMKMPSNVYSSSVPSAEYSFDPIAEFGGDACSSAIDRRRASVSLQDDIDIADAYKRRSEARKVAKSARLRQLRANGAVAAARQNS